MSLQPLTVPQQATRFGAVGAGAFALTFWFTASLLLPAGLARQDQLAARLIIKGLAAQSFGAWLSDLETAFIPFFLAQRALVACYVVSTPVAWLAAYWFDTKVQRRERTL
jgi:hypothetical protein